MLAIGNAALCTRGLIVPVTYVAVDARRLPSPTVLSHYMHHMVRRQRVPLASTTYRDPLMLEYVRHRLLLPASTTYCNVDPCYAMIH
jgi:hypothetical protein